jgi:hypothetical protein
MAVTRKEWAFIVVLPLVALAATVGASAYCARWRPPAHSSGQGTPRRTTEQDIRSLQVKLYDKVFSEQMKALQQRYEHNTKDGSSVAARQYACFRRISALRAMGKTLHRDYPLNAANGLVSECDHDTIVRRYQESGVRCIRAYTEFDNCDANRIRRTIVVGGPAGSCEVTSNEVGEACQR